MEFNQLQKLTPHYAMLRTTMALIQIFLNLYFVSKEQFPCRPRSFRNAGTLDILFCLSCPTSIILFLLILLNLIFVHLALPSFQEPDSSVGTAMAYALKGRSTIPGGERGSSLQCPDRLWGATSLPSRG